MVSARGQLTRDRGLSLNVGLGLDERCRLRGNELDADKQGDDRE